MTRNSDKENASDGENWQDRWTPGGSISARSTRPCPRTNMMSINGETSGNKIWKITMLGSAIQPSTPFAGEGGAMLPDRLQNAERPAKALTHQAIGIDGGFGISQRQIFVFDAISRCSKGHGEVGVFGHGVGMVSAGLAHGRDPPCPDRSWAPR